MSSEDKTRLSVPHNPESELEGKDVIKSFILMESQGHWRIYCLVEKEITTMCLILNMILEDDETGKGRLEMKSCVYIHPDEDPKNKGSFKLCLPQKKGRSKRIKALYSVEVNSEQSVTVDELKEFIVLRHMQRYVFVETDLWDGNSTWAGCRWWCITLFGELELEHKIKEGTTAEVIKYIADRSKYLMEHGDPEADDIFMPTSKGIFPDKSNLRFYYLGNC